MTGTDRESSFVGGMFLVGAGTGITWFAVRQFRDPVATTNSLVNRLGGKRLPIGIKPRPESYPALIRASAILVGVCGALFVAVGVVVLVSAFVW